MSVVEEHLGVPLAAEQDFVHFYRQEWPAVYRAALTFSRSRDIALDAAQEAFARAFSRWRRLSKETWVGGWVMTTALNICRKNLRRRPFASLPESEIVAGPGPDRLDLVAAFAQLPARRRQAAVLYFVGDLSVDAVAHLMDLSEGAVRAHVSLARAELRKRLR